MSTFGESYSNYYNLFYTDKNYNEEVRIVDQYIQHFNPEALTIMDLGCGTGKHAGLLAQRGYKVLGVDRSDAMLAVAKRSEIPGRLSFLHGDLRTLDIPESFDAVISLFHVICYLNENEDLQQAFQNISKHLHKGGLFIFDCWYGPAVLTQLPSVRLKEFKDKSVTVTRITSPILYVNENVVDVHFKIFVKDKQDGTVEEIEESHRIRYLFTPEIEGMLKKVGIELVECFEFLTGKFPGVETWSVCYVGRKL
jgi:SAM-dependent methyltransferase